MLLYLHRLLFTVIINDLIANPTKTIDSVIKTIVSSRNSKQLEYDSLTLSGFGGDVVALDAAKNVLRTDIDALGQEINLLKNAKEAINQLRDTFKNQILNAYNDGTDIITLSTYPGIVFSNYSPTGANAAK